MPEKEAMMKRKHFLPFVCILAVLLAACGTESLAGDDTEPATVTTAPITEAAAPLCLFSGSTSDYQIVRPEVCSETVVSSASAIWRRFEETFGARVSITTDWVKTEADIPTDTPEILIGDTNRAETAAVRAELANGTYRIKALDGRIVICADSEWMLEQAIDAFFAAIEIDAAGQGTVPADLDIVGDLSQYTRPGWFLDGLPAYDDGRLSDEPFLESLHFVQNQAKSKMICIANTRREEFDRYLEKVTANGFTTACVTDRNGITAYRIEGADCAAYAYYTEATDEVRIILEQGDNTPLSAFNYTYEKKPGDTTTIYQFGLMMDEDGVDFRYNNNTRLNCGHMYFMKLADNSIVVIDGGGIQQMSDETADELLRLFRAVTGVPEEQKITISCWFISHRHPDHYNGFTRFLIKYHDQVDIERVLYNIQESNNDIDHIRGRLNAYYKDILYHKPHTGETITLADVDFDVLYTLEDQVDARTGKMASSDFNDTSTVLQIKFDGAKFLLLGDASGGAEKVLVKYYAADVLKSDILQVAHHGWNNLRSLYNAVQPVIALYPQSSGGAARGLGGAAAKVLERVETVSQEIYFAGDETVGVGIVDGKPTVTYRHAIVGRDYDGWGW